MKRILLGIFVAVVACAVTASAVVVVGLGGGSGEGEYGTLYIDVGPLTGNSADSYGTIDTCIGDLTAGTPFDIDIIIDGANDLAGAGWTLYYNKDVLKVTAYNWTSWKLGSNGMNLTEAVPDTDGAFATSYAGGSGVNGAGVLQRLTLQPIADGSSDLKLCTAADCLSVADSLGGGYFYPEVLVDDPAGEVRAVVGGACPPGGEGAGGGASPSPEGREEPSPTPTPDLRAELERLRLEEEAKPTFEGVVNGIRLYRTGAEAAVQRKSACTDAKPEEVEQLTMSAVAGTPMEIRPTYLPEGAEELPAMWPPVACKGIVANVERQWTVRGKGFFMVSRRQGEQAIDIDASAGRVSSATIAGKPAVLVKPLTPDGYGYSMVIVAEDFGLTVIGADGLPIDETIKIAEGLK